MLAQKGLQAQPIYLRGWQSFQPGQFRLGKAGAAAVRDHASAPAHDDPTWHPRGPHGQCRQPYRSCCNDTLYPPYLPLLQKLEQV